MDIIYVGIGGALGSLSRFSLGKLLTKWIKGSYPIAILLINVSGALLLGAVCGLAMPANGYLLLGEGFLGAFTTFSTFMYEGFHLFQNDRANALVYIGSTMVLGILGFMLGLWMIQTI